MKNKYAVIKINGNQYLVEENGTVEVDKIPGVAGDKVSYSEVLLKVDGDKIEIGTPIIEKSTVEGEILEQKRGEKVKTFIYKAKSRYRKSSGQRAYITVLKINKIS